MLSRLFHLGRVLSTGFCFIYFSLWGFSLGVIIFPAIMLLEKSRKRRRERFMKHMKNSWDFFNRFMVRVRAFGAIRVEGLEHFVQNRPCLIVANHVTLVDIVAIGSKIDNFNCIVKESLWRHRFFGMVLRHCEFIPNTGSESLIKQCEQGFSENRPMVIFPAGTRTPPGEPFTFHRGAAQIAVRTGVPVVPILITCDPPALMKGQPWYIVPSRAPDLLLRIQPELQIPDSVMAANNVPLQVRALNEYLESYFRNKLSTP